MPYPMAYTLYRAPDFHAWFCKLPRPCCTNVNFFLPSC